MKHISTSLEITGHYPHEQLLSFAELYFGGDEHTEERVFLQEAASQLEAILQKTVKSIQGSEYR